MIMFVTTNAVNTISMENRNLGASALSDLAGIPYVHDEMDVELAVATAPTLAHESIAAAMALDALTDAKWREAFESEGQTFHPVSTGDDILRDAPQTGLGSPEMNAWIKSMKNRNSVPTSKSLKAFKIFRTLVSGSFGAFGVLLMTLVWLGVNYVLPHNEGGTFSGLLNWLQSTYGLVVVVPVALLVIPFVLQHFLSISNKLSVMVLIFVFFAPLTVERNILTQLSVLAVAIITAVMLSRGVAADEQREHTIRLAKNAVTPSPWSAQEPSTRFGSMIDKDAASTFLRASANQYGVTLLPVDTIDQVASVIAADAWMLAHGANNFRQAASYGPDAILTLSAILARAAGHSVDSTPWKDGAKVSEHDVNGLTSSLAAWEQWLNALKLNELEKEEIWRSVKSDLMRGDASSAPANLARSLPAQ